MQLRNIFEPRLAYKPYEYPEFIQYKDGIHKSFWLISEFNFNSDVQDFKTKLSTAEQSAVKNALLAISQIEVSVKKFWSRLGDRFPKPEIEQVGIVFGNSEVIHSDAYSKLLEVLGLNDDFTMLLQEPVIQGRVEYLTKYLKGAASTSDERFTLNLVLFALLVEGGSLFSQFVLVKAIEQNRGVLKNVSNVISATMQEEQLHMLFGAHLINTVREENPEWFNAEFEAKVIRSVKKAFEAESRIIDWLFEGGELSYLSKEMVREFLKDRFNQSAKLIGIAPFFDVDKEVIKSLQWFEVELQGETAIDFFNKRSVAYTKRSRSITKADIFKNRKPSSD